ncbi:hypothetical protein NC652_006028 [Populus alba x Populus x berolinensis]|nr:hypothetical protein NC652_006025 [Populus alba x Populus x berolinensis]KAJ6954469.1 hypothetical protein NC652_006028 [Populus alba x Populus x berolinensis]
MGKKSSASAYSKRRQILFCRFSCQIRC